MNQPPSIALITGAGSGIGRALAKLLASEGCAIAAVDLREEGLRSLADELAAKSFAWACADVTDATRLQEATRELEAKLGPIDLLVANAGIAAMTSALDYNAEEMANIINVNLIGVSNSIAAVLPGMIERRRGHLVAISSAASYRGLPGMLGYCASKSGVNAIMDGMRIELRPLGIHVTTICPGWIKTAMTDKIQGKLDGLVDVEDAVQEIAHAIRAKKVFYTFPRQMRWSMGILTLLPRAWQDWYIKRKLGRLKVTK